MQRFIMPIIFLSVSLFAQRGMWVETTQKDFSDGVFEHNIYATHRAYNDSLPGNLEFIPRWDYNNDGYLDAVTSHIVKLGYYLIKDSIFVYWGGPEADVFRPDRRTAYPTGGGGNVVGADLNRDGYTEILLANYRLYGNSERGGITIFWGTDSVPSQDYTLIGECRAQIEALTLADLNKDGYLEIIHGGYPDRDSSFGIFWGNPKNTYDSVDILPCTTSRHNFEIADFDKDGYFDIVVVNYLPRDALFQPYPHYIYWGSKDGYSRLNRTELMYIQPCAHGMTVADFDKNGWLDLVFTGLTKVDTAYIYYGIGPRKFSEPVKLHTGKCFGGSIAADINEDGWLDLIFLVGNAEDRAYLKPIWCYWGSKDGFSDENRSSLGPKKWSTSGGLIADFNQDGHLDIWLNDWITLGGYSGLLFGPIFERIVELPNRTDHHAVFWEIGHTYNRQYYEDYVSSVFDAGMPVNWDAVTWIDSTPGNSRVELEVRTGNTPEPDETWTQWIPIKKGKSVPDEFSGKSTNNRYIQYKALLKYQNPAHLPSLYEVRITYGPYITIEPDQRDSTYPGEEVTYSLEVTNFGFGKDVINITTQGTHTNWQAKLYDPNMNPLVDHNGDGLADVDSVAPLGGKAHLILGITPPSDAKVGDIDTTIVWAYSTNNSTIKDSAVIITEVLPVPFVRIWPSQYDSTYVGQPKRYKLFVTNNGNTPDVIDITTNGTREKWDLKILDSTGLNLLGDSDGDGIPDVGKVSGFGKDTISLYVELTPPYDEQRGVVDSTYVVARSSVDKQAKDDALLRTKVLVLLVGFFIEPSDSSYIRPREYKDYSVYVVNVGEQQDTIDIISQGNPEWKVEFLDLNKNPLGDLNKNDTIDIGVLPPYDTVKFILRVTPPKGAGITFTGSLKDLPSRIDNRTLYAFSSIADTRDTLWFQTIVIPEFNVHNYPNPFSGRTTFWFSLPADGKVTLKIYNRAGEHIKTVIQEKEYTFGEHEEPWDGKNKFNEPVAPGLYLYTFEFKPDKHNPMWKNEIERFVVKKALCSPKRR